MDQTDDLGLPIWPAAERNKQPILDALLEIIPQGQGTILEISAATGQHAVHFAPHFPGYKYYVSDMDHEHLATLGRRIERSGIANLMGPLFVDATSEPWPIQSLWPIQHVEVIYNANMMHIAPFSATAGLFRGAGRVLTQGGYLLTYGPYMLDGQHTSVSNEHFDASLKQRDTSWGVRDIADLKLLAAEHGLSLREKRAMPANNFLLVWQKA